MPPSKPVRRDRRCLLPLLYVHPHATMPWHVVTVERAPRLDVFFLFAPFLVAPLSSRHHPCVSSIVSASLSTRLVGTEEWSKAVDPAMNGSHDSLPPDTLRPVNTPLSPAKSGSTSEEEGQIEEGVGAESQPAAHSSRHSSPRLTPSLHDSRPAPERSPSTSWRQSSSGHGNPHASSSAWSAESSNTKARERGYEGQESGPSGSRWAAGYREDRRPPYNDFARHRASSQVYDRYEPIGRSMSIPAYDDRYRDRPPSRDSYDEREREWEREPAWSRSRYSRFSSPSHPSTSVQGRNSWSVSGSMSGPTSPTWSRRDRWPGAVGPSSWERERTDRERDYWRPMDSEEMAADANEQSFTK